MQNPDGSADRRRVQFAGRLSLGLAAAAVGLYAALRVGARSADAPSAHTVGRAAAAAEVATPGGPVPATGHEATQPVRSAAPDVEPGWLRHPFELVLAIHVRDATGRPVVGHVPAIAPAGGMPCSTGVASDEDGIVVVRLPARTPEATIELADPRGHFHAVRLGHDRATKVALVLPAAADAPADVPRLPRLGSRDALHPHARFEVDTRFAAEGTTFDPPTRSENDEPRARPEPMGPSGRRIRGTVHDVHGVPYVDVEVEWRHDDGTFAAASRTDGDGAFEMADLPDGSGLAVVHGPPGAAMPLASRAGVLAGDCDVRFSVSRSGGSVLQVHAARPGAAAGWIAVHDEATDFVALVAADGTRTRNAWQVARLGAGHYAVALRGPGLGEVSLGRRWLDGNSPADLGTAPSTPRCVVDIAPPTEGLTGALRLELVALRPDFDVRFTHRPEPGERLLLPPGDYALLACVAGSGSKLGPVRFTASPGGPTIVRPAR